MARPGEATAQQRDAFSHALRNHLGTDPHAVSSLAEACGVNRVTAHRWQKGEREPQRREVFKIERHLGLPAGSLSSLLGYLPVGAAPDDSELRREVEVLRAQLAAVTAAKSTEDVILTDPRLEEADAARLVLMYRVMTGQDIGGTT